MTFTNDDSGAVTVDWVVLTAALVGLGLAAMAVVSNGVEDLATDVDSEMSNTVIQTSFDPAGPTLSGRAPLFAVVYPTEICAEGEACVAFNMFEDVNGSPEVSYIPFYDPDGAVIWADFEAGEDPKDPTMYNAWYDANGQPIATPPNVSDVADSGWFG